VIGFLTRIIAAIFIAAWTSAAGAQATKLTSLNSFDNDGLYGTLSAIVKVISKGPPGAPTLASSGMFFRRDGRAYVLTTSHGIYHSRIVGQLYAVKRSGEQVRCGILISSYEYDLTLLQCEAPGWNMKPSLPYSTDEEDYYSPETREYRGYFLAGFPANESGLRIEEQHHADPALFLSAPRRMIVPGVKSHFVAPSDFLEPGMSGGLLLLGNRRDGGKIGGMISKKLPPIQGRATPAAASAGVIPGATMSYFIQSTMDGIANGRIQPVGANLRGTVTQDVYAQLEHPLNVRVGQFSYQMAEKSVGERTFKVINVIPDPDVDLNVSHSFYTGINDFKRTLRRYPGCALSIVAEMRGISDGYRYTGEDYFPIPTYESTLSYFILAEGQTNWMGLRGGLLRIDCADQLEVLARIRKIAGKVRAIDAEVGLPTSFTNYIDEIEEKVVSENAASLFPANFVRPLNPPWPCQTNDAVCNRKMQAYDLIGDIDNLTRSLYDFL
jgi:hypothetical protein